MNLTEGKSTVPELDSSDVEHKLTSPAETTTPDTSPDQNRHITPNNGNEPTEGPEHHSGTSHEEVSFINCRAASTVCLGRQLRIPDLGQDYFCSKISEIRSSSEIHSTII